MQDPIEILKSVNEFYTGAFDQLIILTVAILTVSGVLIPLVVSLIQKRFFKLEHKEIELELRKALHQEMQLQVEKLRDEYKDKEIQLEKMINELKEELDKQIASHKGAGKDHECFLNNPSW